MVKVVSTEVKIDHGINGVARQKDVHRLNERTDNILNEISEIRGLIRNCQEIVQEIVKSNEESRKALTEMVEELESTPSGSGEV